MEELLKNLYWKSCVVAYKEGVLEFFKDSEESELQAFLQVFHPGSVHDTMTLLMLWKPLNEFFPTHPTVIEIERILRARLPEDPLLVGHMMFKKMLTVI